MHHVFASGRCGSLSRGHFEHEIRRKKRKEKPHPRVHTYHNISSHGGRTPEVPSRLPFDCLDQEVPRNDRLTELYENLHRSSEEQCCPVSQVGRKWQQIPPGRAVDTQEQHGGRLCGVAFRRFPLHNSNAAGGSRGTHGQQVRMVVHHGRSSLLLAAAADAV